MNNRRRLVLIVAFAGAALLGLSGCVAGEGPVRYVYEATTSGSGGHVTYMETADAVEPIGAEADIEGTSWKLEPELNPGTTTPMVTVTPPPGGSATCRILRIRGEKETLVAGKVGITDAAVVCIAPKAG